MRYFFQWSLGFLFLTFAPRITNSSLSNTFKKDIIKPLIFGLEYTLKEIQQKGWGCVVYLRQEGRGIGLHAKIQAYNLQDKGADTLDANLMLGLPGDARDYSIASEILNSLKINKVSLLTNNPDKVEKLESLGIIVSERVPLIVGVGAENINYLKTKSSKMGHHISSNDLKDSTTHQ